MGVVRRDCMRAQICREVLRRIVEGIYQPGVRLVELSIAREFGTSQAPVREALRDLEALRVVETATYRGTRVREVTPAELIEVAEVRGVLEEASAIRAAEVLKGNTEALHCEAEALNAAGAAHDFDAYARHNKNFHRLIVEAGENRVLLRVWDSLMMEARTRLSLNAFKCDLRAVAATHAPIVEALHQGNGPLAGRLLREHAGIVLQNPSELASFPLANP